MKLNATSLSKLENILLESGYKIRNERGTFQSGFCILENLKVVVLNKFLSLEGRINALLEIIPNTAINVDALTHESQKLLEEISQLKLAL